MIDLKDYDVELMDAEHIPYRLRISGERGWNSVPLPNTILVFKFKNTEKLRNLVRRNLNSVFKYDWATYRFFGELSDKNVISFIQNEYDDYYDDSSIESAKEAANKHNKEKVFRTLNGWLKNNKNE